MCSSDLNHDSPSRGLSIDNNKLTPKGITQLAFSKLVTQTSRDSDKCDQFNNNLISQKSLEKEKIHSLSPPKKIPFEYNPLIPVQSVSKMNKKTLVLDLDETLIHCNDTLDKIHDI